MPVPPRLPWEQKKVFSFLKAVKFFWGEGEREKKIRRTKKIFGFIIPLWKKNKNFKVLLCVLFLTWVLNLSPILYKSNGGEPGLKKKIWTDREAGGSLRPPPRFPRPHPFLFVKGRLPAPPLRFQRERASRNTFFILNPKTVLGERE